MPGASSRDLFIPDRWGSPTTFQRVTFSPSHKGHQQNCQVRFFFINVTLTKQMQSYVCLLHTRTPFYGRFLLCRNQRYEKQEHAATTTWYAIDWIFTYLGVSVISRLNLVDVKLKKGIRISLGPMITSMMCG